MVVSPTRNPTIYTIIVTYNGAGHIAACLESVLASDYPARVVVVDNASQDDTVSIVARFPDVVCLPQEKNHGFGLANNIGMRYALDEGAKFVFLLNQDAYIQPDSIGTLVRAAQENPAFGILSPVHLDETGAGLDALFEEFVRAAHPEMDIDSECKEKVVPLPFINAAAWLVRSDCIRRVGGFDPVFFMRGEDNDYCDRVRFHGFKIGVAWNATIRHERVMRPERDHAGIWRSIKWRAGERKRQMIVALKHPGSSLWRHLFWWGFGILREGLKHTAKMDWRGLIALMMASAAACRKLPVIWSHRRACIAGRMKWLQSPIMKPPRNLELLSGKQHGE